MRYRQLLLVGQLSFEGSSESASQDIITSGSVLSKKAIFPKKQGREREISNESARACIRQTTRQPSVAVQPLKEDKFRYRTSSELENSVLEINHVTNVTTVLMRLQPQIGYLAQVQCKVSCLLFLRCIRERECVYVCAW